MLRLPSFTIVIVVIGLALLLPAGSDAAKRRRASRVRAGVRYSELRTPTSRGFATQQRVYRTMENGRQVVKTIRPPIRRRVFTVNPVLRGNHPGGGQQVVINTRIPGINVTVSGPGLRRNGAVQQQPQPQQPKPPAAAEPDPAKGRGDKRIKFPHLFEALLKFNKTRKQSLDRLDDALASFPKLQQQMQLNHRAFGKLRSRSRAEHRRIWSDMAKANTNVHRLQATQRSARKNNTAHVGAYRRHLREFNKHRDDVLHRIEDIETHQKTQDLRYFEVMESARNNSGDVAGLKEQVRTLNERSAAEERASVAGNSTETAENSSRDANQISIDAQIENLKSLTGVSPATRQPSARSNAEMLQQLLDRLEIYKNQTATRPAADQTRNDVIDSQASLIRKQNETIGSLVKKILKQDSTMHGMEIDLEYQQDMTQKLLTIVTNLAQQMRSPVLQYKDCHDLWLRGHMESGVYSIVRGLQVQPVYCNMTRTGGWTVIQRRLDGTQDFDRGWTDYVNGFGSVYGEYWLGLDTVRWLTHSRIYMVQFLLEDWDGNRKTATYDQFLIYGQEYVLSVKGYDGDAGDSLTPSNGLPFRVRHQDRSISISIKAGCTATRRSGWWFPADCGEANPNGPFPEDPNAQRGDGADDGYRASSMSRMLRWMSWSGADDLLSRVTVQIIPRVGAMEKQAADGGGDDEQTPPDYFDLLGADGAAEGAELTVSY